MTSTRQLKASTLSLVVLVALSLNGCAGKRVWSPELEAATETFEQVSQDPVVIALASEELAIAERQLAIAQATYDQYQPTIAVNQEAQIALLRALTAQQRARALSANHELQVALGQQPLLNEAAILAATAPPSLFEPILAAATPFNSREEMVAHLEILTQQIADLQNQLGIKPSAPTTPANAVPDPLLSPDTSTLKSVTKTSTENKNRLASNDPVSGTLPIQPENADAIAASEPLIGAAIDSKRHSNTGQPTQPASAEKLHRELLGMNARSSSRGMALTLGDRYFEGRSARLWTERANRHLDNVAGFLQRNPTLSLDIEAHTDDEASSEENHDLSIDRAIAIKSQLVLRGVEETRINANGFGESRPIAGNDNTLGRLQNRRVELIFPNIPAKI